MAVPTGYLTTTKNLTKILDSIQKAGVPDQFSYEFLKQLGFASSGDRPIIKVLKDLKFLDESGKPTDRYLRYKDPSDAGGVLAEALRESYQDLFTVNETAQDMTSTALKGAFSRITGASNSVAEKMAMTFKSLSDLADYGAKPLQQKVPEDSRDDEKETNVDEGNKEKRDVLMMPQLHHDIHLHLPSSSEVSVYDAIFKSLRNNLM